MTSQVQILYIAGWGRSGSTVLDIVLGQVEGLVSVGEVKFLWERGLIQNRQCGCGRPFAVCPFWTDVLRTAYGDLPGDTFTREMDRAAKRFRTRHLPLLLVPYVADLYIRRSYSYQERLRWLYGAILEAADAELVVDSSKFPSYLALLERTPGIEVRTVHLVRDPRAVSHSWTRQKRDPDNPNTMWMPRLHPAVTAAYWTTWNAAIERIGRLSAAYLRVRYEDLVATPRSTLESILEFAGISGAALPLIDERTATLVPNHTVSGNPVRFTSGEFAIRGDMAWHSEMSQSHRRWAEIMSAPLRHRYGYE